MENNLNVNLRADLLGELRSQKYFAEIELVRISSDGGMNYKTKIQRLDKILSNIVIIEQKIMLAERYYPQPQPEQVVETPQEQVVETPQPLVQQGQSHKE